MSALADEELVARCKKELPGNTRSYEELVRRHMQRVYDIAWALQLGISAVKMRIHRARLAFQEMFSQFCDQGRLALSVASSGNALWARSKRKRSRANDELRRIS